MYTILDITKKSCLPFLILLPTGVAWDNIFIFFMSVNCIGIFLGGNGAGHQQ